jgi:hypothetical protein
MCLRLHTYAVCLYAGVQLLQARLCANVLTTHAHVALGVRLRVCVLVHMCVLVHVCVLCTRVCCARVCMCVMTADVSRVPEPHKPTEISITNETCLQFTSTRHSASVPTPKSSHDLINYRLLEQARGCSGPVGFLEALPAGSMRTGTRDASSKR